MKQNLWQKFYIITLISKQICMLIQYPIQHQIPRYTFLSTKEAQDTTT